MAFSIYTASVPVFKQYLDSLGAILRKAEAHAEAAKIDPEVLLQARLFPDMFPLVRQVQIAAHFARDSTARIAGAEAPEYDGRERSFADLHELIAKTLAFIDGLPKSAIEGGADRKTATHPGTPQEKTFTGQSYLLSYGMPQFFFHVATAYAILRHNGVVIGKRDFLGQY
ncbi:MAG: DUF1993 domain-containing protein [Candidimonas sp.]|nr:MAG: DUF1993 domain-containing protein [Candidimonas sp.]